MAYVFDEKMICPWDKTASPERIAQYREYYRIKHDICKEFNPEVIVEIGVRAGYSALYFLQAVPKAKYHGFDADNGKHGGQGIKPYTPWAIKLLKKYGYDFEIHSPIDTQEIEMMPVDADFFHIDGDHTTEGVYHDLDLCFNSCKSGGILLIDDYDYIKEVRAGVDKWLKAMRLDMEYRKSLRGEIIVRVP
jgi:predicted O-methyltransferase YrrM